MKNVESLKELHSRLSVYVLKALCEVVYNIQFSTQESVAALHFLR